jgi:uncharacterized protein YegP (UPF0339 family)
MEPYKIQIKQAKNGEHFAKVVAGNNEIVMLGETWKNKSALEDFCLGLGAKVFDGTYRVEMRESEATGKWHGAIVAGNNETVMSGEPWESKSSLEEYLNGNFKEGMRDATVSVI